jgi:hypothetical protein
MTFKLSALSLLEIEREAARTGGPLTTLTRTFSAAGENFVLTVAGPIAMSGAALPMPRYDGCLPSCR